MRWFSLLRKMSGTLSGLSRAVLLVWSVSPGLTALNTVLIICQGVLPLAALYAMKRIVDAVAAALPSKGGGFQQVLPWLLLAALIALLTHLLRALSDVSTATQSQVVNDRVVDIIHARSVALDLAFYEDPAYNNTLHRVQIEAPFRPGSIVNRLLQVGQSSLSLLGIMTLLFSFNHWLGLLLVLAALPGALVLVKFARRGYNFEQSYTEQERLSSYFHLLIVDGAYARELRLFKLGEYLRRRFLALRQSLRGKRLSLIRRRALAGLATQTLAVAAVFSAFGFTAWQAVSGAISIGSIVMYYQGFQSGLGFLQSLLMHLVGLYEDNLFLSNFYQFLALKPRISKPRHPLPIPEWSSGEDGLRLNEVFFTYPRQQEPAVKGVDIRIAPGEVVALVGANGSGKSTIVKLLCRLYDPDKGSVTINGTDIRRLDPDEWRNCVSIIFQDYIHYQMTARENIHIGDIRLDPADERIDRAAHISGADEVIARLQDGYETMLGHNFSGGRELSIGEWQKMALARAFVRDAGLVILDEPSSALDPIAERDVFDRFHNFVGDRSALIISHRLCSVRMADHIYVLENGQIAEHGPHSLLLQSDGVYARLYRAQSEYYCEVNGGL